MSALTSVAVRMYCTGFGDCFLLTFRYGPDGPGQQAKTLWIDFGVRAGQAEPVEGLNPDSARARRLGAARTRERMQAIAQDIRDYVAGLRPAPAPQLPAQGPPAKSQAFVDVLAITHEHVDHISGLKQAAKVLKDITFGQLWFAWTENPREELAQEWRRQKRQARTALQTALTHLNSSPQAMAMSEGPKSLKRHLEHLAEFEPKLKPKETEFHLHPSYQQLLERPDQSVCYLSPGYTAGPEVRQGDVIGEGLQKTPGATVFEGARIYVLGPPKDLAVVRAGEPKHWEQTLHAAAQQSAHDFTDSHFAGSDVRKQDFWYFVGKSPFDERFVVPVEFPTGKLPHSVTHRPSQELPAPESRKVALLFAGLKETEAYHRYFGPLTQVEAAEEPAQPWRRIDHDYVYEAGSLAIQLNNGVNNTSLVLAIELEATKQVLLFSGDAEYGVWNDWERDRQEHAHQQEPTAHRQYCWSVEGGAPVTVEDLLGRTVFYKMGHHGSENATPKSKGIGKLSNAALHSMIPVNEKTARHFGWCRIPFENLLTVLEQRKIPYVRADKSHNPSGEGSLAQAKKQTAASPLVGHVHWNAKLDGSGKHLFVEWKLTI